jgi:hypothetical protein
MILKPYGNSLFFLNLNFGITSMGGQLLTKSPEVLIGWSK